MEANLDGCWVQAIAIHYATVILSYFAALGPILAMLCFVGTLPAKSRKDPVALRLSCAGLGFSCTGFGLSFMAGLGSNLEIWPCWVFGIGILLSTFACAVCLIARLKSH